MSPQSRISRHHRIRAAAAALITAAVGCGYPTFTYGPGGTGGAATTSSGATGGAGGADPSTTSSSGAGGTASSSSSSSSTSSTTSSSTTSSSSSSTSSSTTGGLPPCNIGHLVISEIRTRGPGGDRDEFIELYNPTSQDIVLDGDWFIDTRSESEFSYNDIWTGDFGVVPAGGHYLLTGPAYSGSVPGDGQLAGPIADAASVTIVDFFTTVDAVCFAYDTISEGILKFGLYACEGKVATNAHNETAATNTDKSIERKPGGTAGNCTDSNDNATDFTIKSPSTPMASGL